MGRKVIIGFILAIISLGGIGYYNYLSLTRLVTALHNEANPDVRLLQLQELAVNISEAENAVQAFTINHDNDELSTFYEKFFIIDNEIPSLKASTEDSLQSIWLDSLDVLIGKKFKTLNQLIELTRDQQSDRILEKVKERIARLEREESKRRDTVTSQSPPRKSLFQRLFGGNEKNVKEKTEIDTQEDERLTRELTEAVQRMQEEHAQAQQLLTSAELELFNQNKQISNNIQYFINKFEKQERELSKERAALADAISKETINKISLIGSITIFIIITLLLVILHDIRVNKRTRQRLQTEKKRAEKLALAKQEFLSNISHEIRTPMNSIIGFSEQLSRNELSPVQNKYLKMIRSSSEHLLTIINDLLDYSKMDAGKFKLARVGFRPQEIISEVYESLKPTDKKVNFNYDIAGNVPEIVIGDPVRFRQILINLVNNALKFTPSGKVEIQCDTEKREKESILIVKVIDTGIGIPPKQLKKIFGSFNQAHATSKNYGGTGLGLAICKKLVALHNGSIKVDSTEGKGSIFEFSIPYTTGSTVDLPGEEQNQVPDKEIFRGKRILIADDENYNLILLQTIFEKWGMEVHTVDNGKKAINKVKNNNYDLILMDLQMPEMGGREAARIIKQDLHPDVSIIALTADYSRENDDKCHELGMNDYIIKPIKERDLLKVVSKALATDPEITTKDDPGGRQIEFDKSEYDLSDLKELAAGDPHFVIKMIRLFIKNTTSGLKDIREAAEQKELESVALKAHKIVAPCRHLGLSDIVSKLKEIENEAQRKDFEKIGSLIDEIEQNMESLIPLFEKELDKLEKKAVT